MASNYYFKLLKSSVVYGLTIAIPQGISYAKLANLPPIIQLYSSFVPPLTYRFLKLVLGILQIQSFSHNGNNAQRRLGFVIDFLSKATLLWFTAGVAVIISLQQLKRLLGIVHYTSKMQLLLAA